MTQKEYHWSRRDFLKTASMAGAVSLLTPAVQLAAAADNTLQMPQRPFGKSGVLVSILSVGGTLDLSSNQLMLRQAVKWGVTYWDTAHSYRWGKSEEGVGRYLAKYPRDRPKIFLVTKSGAWTKNGMTADLNESLERMQTDYVDLFLVHGISGIDEMDDETKAWAENRKSEGKIRLFGFSTHSNMAECMLGAAELGWIDGIMMSYNYRLMHADRMRRAVDACANAGIGLTAMKTQAGGSVRTDTDIELKMAGRFLQKGFTDAQAKLMAIWQNPNIASICSHMPNMTILAANAAAALNRTKLSARDTELLQRYARETRSDYCTGCTNLCETAIEKRVPIGDVMRCLMYDRSYGDRAYAVAEYKSIPPEARRQLATLDFSPAERKCPRNMAIGRLMREASVELG